MGERAETGGDCFGGAYISDGYGISRTDVRICEDVRGIQPVYASGHAASGGRCVLPAGGRCRAFSQAYFLRGDSDADLRRGISYEYSDQRQGERDPYQ